MPLRDYQTEIDDWLQNYKQPYWTPLSQLARLVEEVGELSRAYNHKYGEKIKKDSEAPDDIEGEMGDVLFGLICMANDEGLDLDRAIQGAISKAKTRDKDRFEKK
ncbi:MAG: nucleotide pyrophosphohydrolase [Candidatus Saccharibacteria bacterium]|nr:nucleotide pyrophosphohydrolase [Candidatus Saccharibacteria bacterium]